MTQFTAGETSMYEEVPTPPSQELQNLELPPKPSTLFRNASEPTYVNGAKPKSIHPPLRPVKTTLNTYARKRSREDSGETSTDSAESASTPTTTGPATNQSSFNHETKRRTTDKSFDTIAADPFVTAQSIGSELDTSVDGAASKDQDSTALSVPAPFKQPITPLKTQSSSEPDWEAHPEAWGYLKSLNSQYPSAYLEKTNEVDGNGRAGYMLGRSERCELR
jgi:hypothetical protein